MILAAVSPVFERMFYGDFKEGNAKEVELPKDKYNTIRLLVDVIYKGSCEVESIDDTIPLIEVMERYQINKVPLQHMCDEPILSQLDSSNYLTLLPKYVSVMSEEGHKKAADKVMSYTSNDFVTKFDQTKDLPEEVLLYLLTKDDVGVCELDIFEFLVKWHDYQAKELGKSMQLSKELFQSIRYSLIPPHLLIQKVANCAYVDKEAFAKAFEFIFQKPQAYDTDKPRMILKLLETLQTGLAGLSLVYHSENQCSVIYNWEQNYQLYKSVVASNSLANGIFTLQITNISYYYGELFFRITDKSQNYICNESKVYNGFSITVNVYDDDIFLKIVENDIVKLTVSVTGVRPFTYSFVLLNSNQQGKISFQINSIFE